MRLVEALGHVAHGLPLFTGWRGDMYAVCREDSTRIGMAMLERLLERGDIEVVDDEIVLTVSGSRRL